jgi:hypothetical protein
MSFLFIGMNPARCRAPTVAPATPLPSAPRGGSNLWGASVDLQPARASAAGGGTAGLKHHEGL